MIKYAGYDSADHIKAGGNRINARRADELRKTGITWREVADLLSYEANRTVPFTGDAVMKATLAYRKGLK